MVNLEQITLQNKVKRAGLLTRILPFLAVGAIAACGGEGQTPTYGGTGCKKDLDCTPPQICVSDKCVTPGEYCVSNYDCPDNHICENNACIYPLKIPETTKVADDKVASELQSISNDSLTFNLGSEYAKALEAGDLVVAGVYDNIPVGLLRKVTSKTESSSEIVVETEQATLEDAITSGTFTETISLTPEYLNRASPLMNGVGLGIKEAPLKVDLSNKQVLSIDFEEVELSDGITLDGDLKLGLEMKLKLEMSSSQVKYIRFTMEGTEDFNLKLAGEFEAEISEELPQITPVKFYPIFFMAGYVPVVVVPELTITFGVKAQGSLSLETSVSQGTSGLYGLEYNPESEWTTILESDDHFDFNPPIFSDAIVASIEVYAKPKLNFKLYGMAGPSTGAKGYVKGEVKPIDDPWCTLSAGLEVNAGFKVAALSKTLSDYEKVVYKYEKELYKCEEESVRKRCVFDYYNSNNPPSPNEVNQPCFESCSNTYDDCWDYCGNQYCHPVGNLYCPGYYEKESDWDLFDACADTCYDESVNCAKQCCEAIDGCYYYPDYPKCKGKWG